MTAKVEDMIGETLIEIKGAEKGSYGIEFISSSGKHWEMYEEETGGMNDVCVEVEDVCGDIDDIIGEPLVMSELVEHYDVSQLSGEGTWSFYKFATVKGYVTIRWFGTSNGWYSETPDFYLTKKAKRK